MKLLLDTHAFIWWDSNPAQLSAAALTALRDSANTVLLSVVSVWEIIIKAHLGKLHHRLPIADLVMRQQANGLELLPVSVQHVLAVDGLPHIHKDPFDRLLISQAIVEGAELVSVDQTLARYPVRIIPRASLTETFPRPWAL
jgi:PIN domain nuclease of toxin-antitoxin system